MSYIEKKYRKEINQIFGQLPEMENYLLELLNKKSVKIADNLANTCAHFNKSINLILKKYYPEIKEMDDKLEIKSILKFYFDLIDKLTDFIRNIVNFRKIDENYYNLLIDFIEDKENLISGKYRTICTQELTSFYDPHSRENLEKIIAEKFQKRSRQFFTIGTLEEEIKKIAKVAGADDVNIILAKNMDESDLFESAQSVIKFTISTEDQNKLDKIGEELKKYLESKKYKVKLKPGFVITDAKLLPDN
jgi:ribosomal protein L18E